MISSKHIPVETPIIIDQEDKSSKFLQTTVTRLPFFTQINKGKEMQFYERKKSLYKG